MKKIENLTEEEKDGRRVRNIIISSVAGIIAVITIFASTTIVPSGHTGVVVNLGKVTGETFGDGFHFKIPYISKVIKMDNQIQKEDIAANAVSRDLQTVDTTIAVNYHLSNESSANIYKTVGASYVDKILFPAVQESTKAVMASYKAEGLITERGTVSVQIEEMIQNKVQEHGIIIDALNITNFEFSSEFNAAIEAKQVAEQNKLKAETEKERRVIEAEAASKEKTIAAQAEADAAKLRAEGEAKAIELKADAEAKANKKIAESLTSEVLNNKAIEKWNGEYPEVVSGDGTSMLIDISGKNEKEKSANISENVKSDDENN